MTQLTRAQIITIEGPDAIAFAQAQFASKVSLLAVDQWQFSAWLNPQGRVRVWFHLARLAEDRLLLLLRGGDAAAVVESLNGFRFRSKVSMSTDEGRELATGPAMTLFECGTEDGRTMLGCGSHRLELVEAGKGDEQWRLPQLRQGWPWLSHDALERWLPPALSLQRLQAVVTDKGCYPGQEIVARMHFRHAHKQRLHRVILSEPAANGFVLRMNDTEIGRLIDVQATPSGVEALAVLRDDACSLDSAEPIGPFDDFPALHSIEHWPA